MALREWIVFLALFLFGFSTAAWGALEETSWQLEVKAKATAGKAGTVRETLPYALSFRGDRFILQAADDPTLGFGGSWTEDPKGKVMLAPENGELIDFITRKIGEAAELKGREVAVEEVIVKKVSSPSRAVQDWSALRLTLGLSVSYSYSGTLDGLPLKSSGVLVMNAKGVLDDEGTSDQLPGTVWRLTTRESASVQGVSSFRWGSTMGLEFGPENQIYLRSTPYNLIIPGTYTLDDRKKKIVVELSEADTSAFLRRGVKDQVDYLPGIDPDSVEVENIAIDCTAALSGEAIKFSGEVRFMATAMFDGKKKKGRAMYKITAAGVKVTP